MTTLDKLNVGDSARIISLVSIGKERRRMLDLGFISGSNVSVLFCSPFGDPKAYFVRGTIVAIRDEDARKINVEI